MPDHGQLGVAVQGLARVHENICDPEDDAGELAHEQLAIWEALVPLASKFRTAILALSDKSTHHQRRRHFTFEWPLMSIHSEHFCACDDELASLLGFCGSCDDEYHVRFCPYEDCGAKTYV